MFQKYGNDRIRNLLVDRVESTARKHQEAVDELWAYDYGEETNDLIQETKRDKLVRHEW